MSDEEDSLISFKFVLIGDSAVGKTSMCKKFCDDTFDKSQPQTVALEFGTKCVEIEGNRIKLQIWDTAGQERFNSITRAYFRASTAIFLIYDVTNRDSFTHLASWIDDAQKLSPPTSIKILVGNKTDLENKAVSTGEGEEYAKENGLKFFETSALSGDRINDTFLDAAHEVYKKMVEGKIDVNAAQNILKTKKEKKSDGLPLQVEQEQPQQNGCSC